MNMRLENNLLHLLFQTNLPFPAILMRNDKTVSRLRNSMSFCWSRWRSCYAVYS